MGEMVPGTFAGKNSAAGNGRTLEVRGCSFQLRLRGEHAESSVPLLASGWQVKYAEVCRYYASASSNRCNHDFRFAVYNQHKRHVHPTLNLLWILPGLTGSESWRMGETGRFGRF